MTKGERLLRFAAQALGGATLIGLWIGSMGVEWLGMEARPGAAVVIALSAVLLLLLALLAKKLIRIRYLLALGKVAVSYFAGVAMALAMAALILMLVELSTAFTGMMMLIRHGGQ